MTDEQAKQHALKHLKLGTKIRIVTNGEQFTLIEETDVGRRYALFRHSSRTVVWLNSREDAANAALRFRHADYPYMI